jgi:4-hydroxy-tetrahydrodipicolinate synthase
VINNKADQFGRLITAMVTPFDDASKIDFAAVERLVAHLFKTGTSAIVVAGTTGESPTLDESEKADLLKCVLAISKGKGKVIMGAGSNSTKAAAKYCQVAESLGADGLLVVAPYYNKPSQSGLLAHFKEVAKATALPIIVYNIPGRTGVNISVDTTVELAETVSNIVAIKDSTGDLVQAAEIAGRAPNHFKLYSGDDVLTVPFLSVGACSVVSVASHIVGQKISEMNEAFFKGDVQKASQLHGRYLPLFKGLFMAPNPTCVKYALAKQGICKAHLRLPLVELDSEQRAAFEKILVAEPLDKVDSPKQASLV